MFPAASSPHVTGDGWSDCAKQGFALKATRGDAVFFWVRPTCNALLPPPFPNANLSCPPLVTPREWPGSDCLKDCIGGAWAE